MREKRSDAAAERFRKIPSVSEILTLVSEMEWTSEYPREQVVRAIREELSEIRERLRSKDSTIPEPVEFLESIRRRVKEVHRTSLIPVINATGIIVHTNLGRAPLAQEAIERLSIVGAEYTNLEFDLQEGRRGSREKHIENVLSILTGSEASLVVNNNAAALLLILNTLSEGKEVLVSRGELVEIGGSFRLPEIMKKSGAILQEVGTTNKTRLEDYRDAINERTGMVLIVHPSNFQIIGFTEKPSVDSLVALSQEKNIPLVEDHGSGILVDLTEFGIPGEPTVQERLSHGIDVICFSGDKILGGPQAGIVCGKRELVEEMRKNPLFRAMRVSKMIYAALETTLLLYLRRRFEEIPVLAMLSAPAESLKQRGQIWLDVLKTKFPEASFEVEKTTTYVGGGVAPMKGLDSYAVSLTHPKFSAHEIASLLRQSTPPVIARVEEDRVFFEMRTIRDHEVEPINRALQKVLS